MRSIFAVFTTLFVAIISPLIPIPIECNMGRWMCAFVPSTNGGEIDRRCSGVAVCSFARTAFVLRLNIYHFESMDIQHELPLKSMNVSDVNIWTGLLLLFGRLHRTVESKIAIGVGHRVYDEPDELFVCSMCPHMQQQQWRVNTLAAKCKVIMICPLTAPTVKDTFLGVFICRRFVLVVHINRMTLFSLILISSFSAQLSFAQTRISGEREHEHMSKRLLLS